MEKIKLSIKDREGKTPNQLRREAQIPGTMYGAGEPSKVCRLTKENFRACRQPLFRMSLT